MRTSVTTILFLLATCGITQSSVVRFETNVGNFDVLLFEDVAPNTVANFLSYVEAGSYDGTIVHRNVPNFVIQGGGYDDELEQILSNAPIENEFATSNTRGTIGMARTTDPNSATTQWFINVGNNEFLDEQAGGFTVFGEVIGDGMKVVDVINQLPIVRRHGPFGELPLVSAADMDSFVVVNRVHAAAVPEPSSICVWVLVMLLGIARMRMPRT